MPILQEYELDEIDNTYNKNNLNTFASGKGLYLNPNYGKGVNETNGEGLGDIFKSVINTGANFLKNHGSTLANVATIASGTANAYKAIKDVSAKDAEQYQLQRITKELEAANASRDGVSPSKISNATLENLKKIRKTEGGGLKKV